MSIPPGVILSSPSKNSSSMLSQAGNLDYSGTEVRQNIASDVKQFESCDFDHFLRYFLSLCLDGTQRTTFEKLQTRIEALQHERYTFKTDEDGAYPSGTPSNEERVSEEETQLINERDALLDGIFDTCLTEVLSVANDMDIRTALLRFSDSINQSAETSRYKPYADLSNEALDLLGKKEVPGLRLEASHHLRTCRADPISIESMSGLVQRKPDLIRTSLAVANDTRDTAESGLGEKPKKKFTWAQVLSCEEMKAYRRSNHKTSNQQQRTSKKARAVEKPNFQFNTERQIVKRYEEIKHGEVVDTKDTTEVPTSSVQTSTSINDRVGTLSQTRSQPKRPRSESTPSSSTGPNKKARSSQTRQAAEPINVVDANTQLATYALEMLSSGPGVHHAINTLIIDEHLWVWYYDRQGIIRSDGISIIADFPRFLVLLLAFQRFTLEDWGVIPCLNAQALSHLGIPESEPLTPAAESVTPKTKLVSEMEFSLEGAHFSRSQNGIVDVPKLDGPVRIFLDQYLCPQPRCVPGRATAVLKATCGELKLACKISNPEAHRSNEGKNLRLLRAIAKKKDDSMLAHLPSLYFNGDIKGCETIRVRSVLGLSIKGYRVLRVLFFLELEPLSKQTGHSFAQAWLDVVKLHAFAWKHGIEHGDPSLWNVMYNPNSGNGSGCGVLTDYDLSIIQWLPRVPGSERTGTIPFMATALLKKEYGEGKIIRCYHHELEAFFWILPFVFLAYKEGKRDPEVELISGWVTADRAACRKEKTTFLKDFLQHINNIQPDFKGYRQLLSGTFSALNKFHSMQDERGNDLDDRKILGLPLVEAHEHEIQAQVSNELREAFISCLEKWDSLLPLLQLPNFIEKFRQHNPIPDNEKEKKELIDEMKQIYADTFGGLPCEAQVTGD